MSSEVLQEIVEFAVLVQPATAIVRSDNSIINSHHNATTVLTIQPHNNHTNKQLPH